MEQIYEANRKTDGVMVRMYHNHVKGKYEVVVYASHIITYVFNCIGDAYRQYNKALA